MVFCQSDIFHGNYIIDADNRVTAIDFADSSIVPSSLAKFSARFHNLGVSISQWVNVPATEGIDNTEALLTVYGPMVMGSHSFDKVGRRLPGGDDETQNRINQSLPEEVRTYPRNLGPTLGEVMAAREANKKLGKEPEDDELYSYMALNSYTSRPRKPRELIYD